MGPFSCVDLLHRLGWGGCFCFCPHVFQRIWSKQPTRASAQSRSRLILQLYLQTSLHWVPDTAGAWEARAHLFSRLQAITRSEEWTLTYVLCKRQGCADEPSRSTRRRRRPPKRLINEDPGPQWAQDCKRVRTLESHARLRGTPSAATSTDSDPNISEAPYSISSILQSLSAAVEPEQHSAVLTFSSISPSRSAPSLSDSGTSDRGYENGSATGASGENQPETARATPEDRCCADLSQTGRARPAHHTQGRAQTAAEPQVTAQHGIPIQRLSWASPNDGGEHTSLPSCSHPSETPRPNAADLRTEDDLLADMCRRQLVSRSTFDLPALADRPSATVN